MLDNARTATRKREIENTRFIFPYLTPAARWVFSFYLFESPVPHFRNSIQSPHHPPLSPPFPPSPLSHPPDTFTQMTTVPNLCTPVELHRHPESRRLVSKMCNSETSQATSRSKKVRTPQTMGITGHLGKLYGLPLIAQKKCIGKSMYVEYFSYFCKKFFDGIDGKNMG